MKKAHRFSEDKVLSLIVTGRLTRSMVIARMEHNSTLLPTLSGSLLSLRSQDSRQVHHYGTPSDTRP
jgi:hypothetical protein